MSEKIRAVIIGFAHMHVNEIAQYISEQPDFELVGGADLISEIPESEPAPYTRQWNREFVRKTYRVPLFEDYIMMIEKLKPDIAFLLCENYCKADIALECAKRGVNIVIEKPLAMNVSDGVRIRKIRDDYGVEIFVNWPIAWRAWLHEMKSALDSGVVGRLIKIHTAAGHTGPLGVGAKHRGVEDKARDMTEEQKGRTWWYRRSEGGGVLLDMMCYGCMYSCMYTDDKADSVIADFGNLNTGYADIQDNAVAVFKYPSVMAVADATWTTPALSMPPGPALYCSDGVITCHRRPDGHVDVAAVDLLGNPVSLPVFSFPKSMKNIAWHYAAYRTYGTPIHDMLTLERNVEVMAMVEAVTRSCENGRQEKILYG